MNIPITFLTLRRLRYIAFAIMALCATVAIICTIKAVLTETWRSGDTWEAKMLFVMSYVQLVFIPLYIISEVAILIKKNCLPEHIHKVWIAFCKSEHTFQNEALNAWKRVVMSGEHHERLVTVYQLDTGLRVTFDITTKDGSLKPTFCISCLYEKEKLAKALLDLISIDKKIPIWSSKTEYILPVPVEVFGSESQPPN